MVVQWLTLGASNAGHMGSIPGVGSSTCILVNPGKKERERDAKTSSLLTGKPLIESLMHLFVYSQREMQFFARTFELHP